MIDAMLLSKRDAKNIASIVLSHRSMTDLLAYCNIIYTFNAHCVDLVVALLDIFKFSTYVLQIG